MHPAGTRFSDKIEVRMKNDNRELYSQLSLVALIKKIVEESDALALEAWNIMLASNYGVKISFR